MLESQYQGFAEAAKLGNVGDKYIDYGELWCIYIHRVFPAMVAACVITGTYLMLQLVFVH